MKDLVPPESIEILTLPTYDERRKVCQCDCYQAELLEKLCPFLETVKTEDVELQNIISEALRYKK
jgi:hypothetical protein